MIQAAQMVLYEASRLAEGGFALISISNMFIDCVSRVIMDYNRAEGAAREPPASAELPPVRKMLTYR